ncbi:MAG: hypothetical protein ACXWV1_06350 [Chitinophagaceae bacterium]
MSDVYRGVIVSISGKDVNNKEYVYRGDKQTDEQYKLKYCMAVPRPDGKCIRGRNGNMLVSFNGKKVIVIARQLRKVRKQPR